MIIPFPFAISFNKNVGFTEFSSEQIETITKKLKSETVDISSATKKLIEFDVSFFRFVWNWNVMVPVDHGQIELIQTENGNQIEYKVSLIRFMIFAVIMSTIMGLVSDSFGFFLVVLTLFLGANWLIAWIRQKFYFESIMKKIKNDAPTKPIRNAG